MARGRGARKSQSFSDDNISKTFKRFKKTNPDKKVSPRQRTYYTQPKEHSVYFIHSLSNRQLPEEELKALSTEEHV